MPFTGARFLKVEVNKGSEKMNGTFARRAFDQLLCQLHARATNLSLRYLRTGGLHLPVQNSAKRLMMRPLANKGTCSAACQCLLSIKPNGFSSYDGSYAVFSCVCVSQFYDVYAFYHKAYLILLLLLINIVLNFFAGILLYTCKKVQRFDNLSHFDRNSAAFDSFPRPSYALTIRQLAVWLPGSSEIACSSRWAAFSY